MERGVGNAIRLTRLKYKKIQKRWTDFVVRQAASKRLGVSFLLDTGGGDGSMKHARHIFDIEAQLQEPGRSGERTVPSPPAGQALR